MSLVLDLPAELEKELAAEASRAGLPVEEYVVRLLVTGRIVSPPLRQGPELVAYWQGEGLVGSRTDVQDSAAHARALRERAERREQL